MIARPALAAPQPVSMPPQKIRLSDSPVSQPPQKIHFPDPPVSQPPVQIHFPDPPVPQPPVQIHFPDPPVAQPPQQIQFPDPPVQFLEPPQQIQFPDPPNAQPPQQIQFPDPPVETSFDHLMSNLRAFQQSLNFDSGDDSKKRQDALLKFLKTEVESEEWVNLDMTGFDLTDATSYKRESKLKKDKIFTSASLLTSSVGAENFYVYCSRKHEPTNCFKAQKISYNEKLKVLKDNGYGFKCLKVGHRVGKCRYFVKCLCSYMHRVSQIKM
ncbi:uncharacterized protein TNCT_283031 [Trichonephila clavata]|uniref:Uncharacterized protein n=1 Tax=Trichonephila clavata TaxID=2740835 RepID=A0A8X6FFA8_TRICU|nr:uncharacterized protein TNCT_283031 [Trichonephila clavata]